MKRLAQIRKALAPLILGVLAVPIQWIANGEFDLVSFRTALAGLITGAAVYYVRNEPPAHAQGHTLGSAVIVDGDV